MWWFAFEWFVHCYGCIVTYCFSVPLYVYSVCTCLIQSNLKNLHGESYINFYLLLRSVYDIHSRSTSALIKLRNFYYLPLRSLVISPCENVNQTMWIIDAVQDYHWKCHLRPYGMKMVVVTSKDAKMKHINESWRRLF